MALFGKHNYATPFGTFSPSGFFNASGEGFYDYSGFSSREGFLGFSGSYEGFSGFCNADGLEFLPWRPTLVFPRNYAVLENEVTIIWEQPTPPDVCGDGVTYEVQFTRSFSSGTGWRTLAVNIPSSQTSFTFDVSEVPFTEDGGIRVRARDSRNLCSSWSSNVIPFQVKNHAPAQVVLLAPVGKQTFDNYILVMWREADSKDVDGHQVFYTVQATGSFSSGKGWTTIPDGGNLIEGTNSFTINSFDFPEGDDYGIRVTATDELGAFSDPIEVGPLKVRHSGAFIIDTVPPIGSLDINDGAPLATDGRIKLSLFARDDTTGVKDVRFRNEGEECWGDWDTYAPQKFWDLTPLDGVKRVFVQYRDYAGNVSEVCDCEVISRVFCDEGNATDLEVFNGRLYAAFDANGTLVEYKVLTRRVANLEEPQITALAKLENALYMASYDPDSEESIVYRYDGSTTRITSVVGAKILTMKDYGGKIYMGLDNGRIMELDGSLLSTSYLAPAPVSRLRTDGTVLLAALLGGGEFLSFDGSSWKVNVV